MAELLAVDIRENRTVQEATYLLSVAHRIAPLAAETALAAMKMTGQVEGLLAEFRKTMRSRERAATSKPPEPVVS